MKSTILLGMILASSLGIEAQAKNVNPGQTPAELEYQSQKLSQMLHGKNIFCKGKDLEFEIRTLKNDKNVSNEFELGPKQSGNKIVTVVKDKAGYGTNEVWQVFVGDDIIVTYGEEANYTVITSVYWLNTDYKDDGAKYIVNDDSTLLPITCSLK